METATKPPSHWRTFAAVCALFAGGIVWMVMRSAPPAAKARPIEARVSGVDQWAPYRGTHSAASVMVTNARGGPAADERRADAIASLMNGRPRPALRVLEKLAQSSNDASTWSDLAAAYDATATAYDAPELLGQSLAAADRALELDREHKEALFNRAIVLEKLGLRDDARAAWWRYLNADGTSAWAVEARQRIDALKPVETLLARLDREYERVVQSADAAAELVRSDPRAARGAGLMDVLGRWGQAVTANDERAAQRHLAVARALGTALRARGGDRMLDDAVNAIAKADPTARSLLAQAHIAYTAGLAAYQAGRPVDAEPLLRHAAAAFDSARSPMALPARYFAANMVYEQGNHAEAERQIDAILPTISADYPGYRAIAEWEAGVCRVSRAAWGDAIRLLTDAASIFHRLGEASGAAGVRRLLTFAYDRIGDPETAWKMRVASLAGIGLHSDINLVKSLATLADDAIVREQWQMAQSFLTLTIDASRRAGQTHQLAEALYGRALVRDRLGRDAGVVRSDLAEADAATAQVRDAAYQLYLRVTAIRTRASLSTTPPAEAEALLGEAIAYQAEHSDPLNLPGLHLQRARARRKQGHLDAALADVQSGIAALEQHRESLPEGEARWGAFHASEELFAEAIDISIDRSDVNAAFRFAEEARARALLDVYRSAPGVDVSKLPASTLIVEYASLPSRVVIFTIDRASGVRAATVERPRADLQKRVEAFVRSLRDSSRADGAAVYADLVAPIELQLTGAANVVFVPDAVTSIVPFGALRGAGGTYLVERASIATAPSVAAFAALAARPRSVPASALVIAASGTGADHDVLTKAAGEAARIAQLYRTSVQLADAGAHFDALQKHAADADVLHFAGHAVGDDSGIEPASIILRDGDHERRVGASELAKLKLRKSATVVLAGCSTARGERRAAEGVVSVAYGFLLAGAPSVIATLWPIDDAYAAVFFPRLHHYLAAGESPSDALRAAQIECIRNGDVPASLWAAVQDFGR